MPQRAAPTAAPFLPPQHTLPRLRAAAVQCKGCGLWKRSTQTVFGSGPARARIILVGEQPGDDEDLAGKPFVGPAGKLLDRALSAAGIDRRVVYVTNAVKHFKWEARGRWRIHKKPKSSEIAACRPWLDAEMEAIRPDVIVCLGATAAQALLGSAFRVTRQRGELIPLPHGPRLLATVHPAAVLRAPDHATRARELAHFIADLKHVSDFLVRGDDQSAEAPSGTRRRAKA